MPRLSLSRVAARVADDPAAPGESGGLTAPLAVGVVIIGLLLTLGYFQGTFNDVLCDGECGPSAVAAPDGIGEVTIDEVAAQGLGAAPVSAEALATSVADALADPRLGTDPGFVAVDLRTGAELFRQHAGAHIPASTTKLLTGFAALQALGPDHRFATSVRRDGQRLVLVAGGDPYLHDVQPADASVEFADLKTLAASVAEEVGTDTTFTLEYDLSLFEGDRVPESWKSSYISSGVATEITPLTTERFARGTIRERDQAAVAANRFAGLLAASGVQLEGRPGEGAAAGERIAQVESPPLSVIVDFINRSSNNDGSEMLFRHIAIAREEPATLAGGATAVTAILAAADISTQGLALHDGSGLSRANRITPVTLTDLLVAAADDPTTATFIGGMPVGGFNGTLTERFEQAPEGRGWVRAKTGALNGVVTLAGVVMLSDGRPVAFAVMADQTDHINQLEVQAAVDALVAAMAGCGC